MSGVTTEQMEIRKEFLKLIDRGFSAYMADLMAASNVRRRRTAELVRWRIKFPNLIEGSSGWHRAVANRRNRLRVQP